MNAVVSSSVIKEAIGVIAGCVPSRSPKAILMDVKMLVDIDRSVTLMASDLEIAIRRNLTATSCVRPGEVMLPFVKFLKVVQLAPPDSEIEIELNGDVVSVQAGKARYSFAAQDPSLFPEPPRHPGTGHALNADAVARAIRRTAFATDDSSTRFALAGVLLDPTDSGFVAVGTDGRRLSMQALSYGHGPTPEAPDPAPVVPVKALKLIERNLDRDEPVLLAVDPGKSVAVRTGRAEIWSRLVEGRFPNYRSIIPTSFTHRATFAQSGELLSAVEQAAIVTSKESRGVDFAFEDGTLKLASQTADIGESHVELPFDGDAQLAVTMDASYAVEMLRTLEPDEPVTMEMTDAKTAVLFKAGDDYTYVLMPLNRDR